LPLTTLGQETRWAYSTTPPSPHGAGCERRYFSTNVAMRGVLTRLESNKIVFAGALPQTSLGELHRK